MVARAVSAKALLTPFADLALLAAIAGTPALAIWAAAASHSGFGLLTGLAGFAVVILIGRATIGLRLTVGVAGATWLAIVAAGFVAVVVLLTNCAPTLDDPWVPWIAMGIVYAGLGVWSLRIWRSVWGVPLASVVALSVGLLLVYTLPGTPGICD